VRPLVRIVCRRCCWVATGAGEALDGLEAGGG